MRVLVSVVIATYNRASLLSKALDSLLAMETDENFVFEILVVDNNSKDETKTVVESFFSRVQTTPLRLRYVFEPDQGKPMALNRGIKEAQGEVIVFTDDDVVVERDWIKNMMRCFREFNCDSVGGRVLPVYPSDTPKWVKDNPHKAAGAVVIYHYGTAVKPCDDAMDFFIGANYAFRRQVFDDCGLFKTDFKFNGVAIGEDREFIRRIVKAGKKLYYCGNAVVWHPVNLDRLRLRHMVRWHMAFGRCSARIEQENKEISYVYFMGVPQYLIKGAVKDFFTMVFKGFNQMVFWDHFRGFFRKVGMIKEYRIVYESSRRSS